MLTITPSNAPWLSSCHFRFESVAVRRQYPSVKGQSKILKFGSVTHECLARLFDPKTPGCLPHADNLDTILNLSFLRAPYDNDTDRAFDKERCRKLLLAYLDQADDMESDATVAVERSGTFPVKIAGEVLYSLSARLDRVMRFQDRVVGLDWKIGSKIPPLEGILVNSAVLKASYPGAPRYEFWYENLSDTGAERTVYRCEQLRVAIHGLTAQVQRFLRADTYEKEQNEGCHWCPLRGVTCQVGAELAVDVNDLDFD